MPLEMENCLLGFIHMNIQQEVEISGKLLKYQWRSSNSKVTHSHEERWSYWPLIHSRWRAQSFSTGWIHSEQVDPSSPSQSCLWAELIIYMLIATPERRGHNWLIQRFSMWSWPHYCRVLDKWDLSLYLNMLNVQQKNVC